MEVSLSGNRQLTTDRIQKIFTVPYVVRVRSATGGPVKSVEKN
jgi:hypothetical protein